MNKKFIYIISLLFCSTIIYAQEALKSIEEEYYDFLSLYGITERPTLGYRSLSDNEWKFKEITDFLENEDGTFSKIKTQGYDNINNIWLNNNLGKKYIIWEPSKNIDNFLLRGLNQNLKVKFYGPEWFNSYNTDVPYGQNDGALWQGVGYNTSFTTGARFEFYGLALTIKPQLTWNQNKNYDYLPGVYGSPYSYGWAGGIDLVQRYGDKSFFGYDWGDSEIRYSWYNLTFGFGTQNAWLGPAYLNPMLGSNNAPGYPKFDIGLRKTDVIIPLPKSKSLNLGQIEGRIWTGMLSESKYFDTDSSNDKRMISGLSVSYAPSFIPGLTIGLNRIFSTYWKLENLKYIYRLFTGSRSNATFTGNDEDQKFSLFAEWSFPKVGFTVYGELGRDDFSYDEKADPFHTAVYTLGVKQYIPLPFNLKSELILEWNNFEMSQDFQLQWEYMGYYIHGFVVQGYTNNGQILGAGTGYFGNSQFIQYKIYYPKGYTLFKFHRHNPNTNSIYSKAVNDSANNADSELTRVWYHNFETYYTFGLETAFFCTKDCLITLGFNYSKIYHRNYTLNTGKNINAYFTLKYNL